MLDEVEALALQISYLIPFIDFVGRIVSPVIKDTYLACLKVFRWFIFAIYDWLIEIVNWEKEVYSEPCKISEVELFAKLVNN